jgi:hypothetical protein
MIRTPQSGGWRDPRGYAAIGCAGRTGLAWEVLRRDPAYRAVAPHRRVGPVTVGGPILLDAAAGAHPARWGLHFRRGCG